MNEVNTEELIFDQSMIVVETKALALLQIYPYI